MEKGKIKNFFPGEGYGFITTSDDEEFFFHMNDLHAKSKGQKLYEGLDVAFDIKSDMKGDKAVNIRVVK